MEILGQKENEKVIKVLHQHPAVLVRSYFKILLIVLIPIYILVFTQIPILLLVSFAVLVISLCFAFYLWVNWYRDIYAITSERLINIEQKGFFTKKVSEISLDKVQDATYSVSGPLATLFHFGTVEIISSSSLKLGFRNVKNPQELQQKIIQLSKDSEIVSVENSIETRDKY